MFMDEDIWKALEQSHLKRFLLSTRAGLEFECGEGGLNFRYEQQ